MSPPVAGADPLADLRDWHDPGNLSELLAWWPPAPGWWVLAGLAVLLIGLALFWWARRRSRLAVMRAARLELAALSRGLEEGRDGRGYAAGLSRLLRRLALLRYPREQVAGLSGGAWLDFLDATGGKGEVARGAGRLLVEGAYRRAVDLDQARDLGRLVARWVEANAEVRS